MAKTEIIVGVGERPAGDYPLTNRAVRVVQHHAGLRPGWIIPDLDEGSLRQREALGWVKRLRARKGRTAAAAPAGAPDRPAGTIGGPAGAMAAVGEAMAPLFHRTRGGDA